MTTEVETRPEDQFVTLYLLFFRFVFLWLQRIIMRTEIMMHSCTALIYMIPLLDKNIRLNILITFVQKYGIVQMASSPLRASY